MRRHQHTGTVADMVRNIAILVGIIVATSAVVTAAGLAISEGIAGRSKPVPHIDAANNVICYTYRDALECMAYHDEGTHLEIQP